MLMKLFRDIKTSVLSIAVLAMLLSFSGYSNHVLPQVTSSEWIIQNIPESSYGVYQIYETSVTCNFLDSYLLFDFNCLLLSSNDIEQVSFKSNYAKSFLLKTSLSRINNNVIHHTSLGDVDPVS